MNKITLIIPDLHHRWEQAEKIIAAVGADEVLFLGDYFDDFGDNPAMVKATTDWLEDSVAKPNRIHLWGNHDVHYAFVYKTFQCSGYEQWKYFIVHDSINPKVWDKLKFYHFLDNKWLLTHAGLHKLNVPDSIKKFRKDRPKFVLELSGWLDHEIRKGFNAAADGNGSWIFNAGAARWGHQRVGGITWCDFQREFFPVQGINQIVGHTPSGVGHPQWCMLGRDPLNTDGKVWYRYENGEAFFKPENLDDVDLSYNLNLDVLGNTHYGIWNGKELKIGNYRDL